MKAILISEDCYTQHFSLAKAAMHYYHVVYLLVSREYGTASINRFSLTITQIFGIFSRIESARFH